jgi:peptidoglycan hydrolase-like protein with peptidoglycan-binding domain
MLSGGCVFLGIQGMYDPYARPTLREDSRGLGVKQLQENLNLLGYDTGAADGIFGPRTKAAVTAFQGEHGLVQDGIYGPLSRKALAAALKDPGTGTPSGEDGTPPDINELIDRLNTLEARTNEIQKEITELKDLISKVNA